MLCLASFHTGACAADNGLAQSGSINTRAGLRLLCVDTIIIPSLKGSLVNYGNKTALRDTPHGLGTCKTQLQSQSKRKHKHKTAIHFLKNVEKKKKKEGKCLTTKHWPLCCCLVTSHMHVYTHTHQKKIHFHRDAICHWH